MTVLSDRVDALEATNSTLIDILNGLRGTLQGAIDAGQGPQGWSPELTAKSDGDRRVLQITDWVNGALGTTKPATGGYIGETGIVATAAEAVDIRGGSGLTGSSAYQAWLDLGNTGDEQDFIDDISAQAVSATAANVTAAGSAQTAAETARDKAQRWATEAQGVEVETGLYSAYHHALAAAASAGSASDDLGAIVLVKEAVETIFDNFDDRYLGSFSTANEPTLDNDGDAIQIGAIYLNTDEDELRFWNGALWKSPEATAEAAAAAALASAAAAGTSETNAATSETKAQQWAEQVEDVEVEAGQYSALHHAAKAEEHANAASLASNATKWVSEGAYDEGQLVWSPLNGLTYRSLVAHSDETTDPSLDEINFGPATGGSSVEWGDVENKPTAFPPSTHDHAVSDITGLQGALDAKAPLASPTLTGTPTVPTATPGTNTTQIANTAFVKAALDNLLAGAPGALDTLNELAAAIGDDADFAGTITAALALKANTADLTPVATAGTYASLTGKPTLGTAAALSVPVSGDAASGEVVKGNDSRLTDARAPTSHNHDDRYYTESEVTSALSGKANSYHTHTVSHLPIATQAQAEAGTLSTVLMTPQRTAQAIAELVETGGSEVYSGSSNTETNFPVGHTILVNSFSTDTARNASAAVYTRSDSNAEEYVLTDQGDLLAGTWRARGNAGNYTVFQRTA